MIKTIKYALLTAAISLLSATGCKEQPSRLETNLKTIGAYVTQNGKETDYCPKNQIIQKGNVTVVCGDEDSHTYRLRVPGVTLREGTDAETTGDLEISMLVEGNPDWEGDADVPGSIDIKMVNEDGWPISLNEKGFNGFGKEDSSGEHMKYPTFFNYPSSPLPEERDKNERYLATRYGEQVTEDIVSKLGL
ncbi:hypothetical protein KY349_04190 [Candidatus Woesearchaeota archaeon]|nr:hypothetical protein [Candidatus Woesearchaeota archaeon]